MGITTAVVMVLLVVMAVRLAQTSHPAPAHRVARRPPSAPATYTNPVIATDFPDPTIAYTGTDYVAISTGSHAVNLPVEKSSDLADWRPVGDALPVVPTWAVASWSHVWAPDLERVGNTWVLWFAALDTASDHQCIGWATAGSASGPFRSVQAVPSVCQTGLGGSIDPSVFVGTEGKRWLLWKNDGNCCGQESRIWSEPLASDGTSLEGTPTPILSYSGGWETGTGSSSSTVEKPAMVQEQGVYHLFFSGNGYATSSYAVGHAVCTSPAGPCQATSAFPVLSSLGSVAGPGGASIFRDRDGGLWIAYAAWTLPEIGYPSGGARSLRIDRLYLAGDLAVVVGPTTAPVPLPG